jgi:electron transport complex protein RnfB
MSLPSADRRIPLVDQIEACLPQTQCGKCQTPGCRPYAEAIAAGEAINHCVPGGADTIGQLARLLGKPELPLDPAYGLEPQTRLVAYIREPECIGCTKCIQACPVDAIVGAAKHMHTVIIDDCTGCELCVAPCPVDCIDMLPLPLITDPAEKKARAAEAKLKFEKRNARLARDEEERNAGRATAPVMTPVSATAEVAAPANAPRDNKALVIAAALGRTNLKKAEKRLLAAQEKQEDTAGIEAEIVVLKAELERINREMAG